ncbi:MAG: alpha/beta hydrolase [Chloroflexi bacterium]|nr:alpha/beta hydrolase [Chloroflexota bacterium]
MPSPQLAEALDFLHKNAVPLGASVAERRAILDDRVRGLPALPGIHVEPVTADGVPAEWVSVDGVSADRVMLFLHGGGYVAGSAAGGRDFVARLCTAAGARALSLDYHLAPEAPFPAAIQDCVAAYRWLLRQDVPAAHCAIVGPSAGGGLVAATLLALRDAGDPLPACGVCMCPFVDMTGSAASLEQNADKDVLAPIVARSFADLYLQGADPRQPLASPIFADLSGLPPLLIQAGTIEVLLDDARALAAQGKACGVEVTYEEWEGMFHGWQTMAALLPEGVQAIAHVGDFIRSH